MSQADVKRFIDDLKTKPKLLAGLKGKATGIAAVAAYAAANGYAVTADEVRAYIRSHSLQNLSDAHIDHLAGGKSTGPGGQTPPTSNTQTDVAAVIVLGPIIGGQVVQVAQAQGQVVAVVAVA